MRVFLKAGPHVSVETPVDRVIRNEGATLDSPTRSLMETRLGSSFADVRVFSDGEAAASAQQMGAASYAFGSRVVFGAGNYAPHSLRGQFLLAHELAHVVQQRGARRTAEPKLITSPSHEQDARRAAEGVVSGSDARVRTSTAEVGFQRFEFAEHQMLGNQATSSGTVNIGGTTAATRFELTSGDVIALSGDFFDPDDLMRLAAIPGNRGQATGTRDEIIFVLYQHRRSSAYGPGGADPRFEPGGVWHGWTFSDAVRTAVNTRYQNLAARNASHFVAPRGRSATGTPNPPVGTEGSAGLMYRSFHERAISMAYLAGRTTGGVVDQALGMEAAAQHFLTDAFSAGHLRTPIGSMRDYWQAKYPLFWYNLLHKIALDTATQMNAQTTNLTTIFGTVRMMYDAIIAQVNAMTASLPQVTLGDLIAKIFHDFDNEQGIAIVGGNRVYGDSHLLDPNPLNVTSSIAQGAIQAGNRDVEEAFRLGQSGAASAALTDPQVFASVRTATGAPGAVYNAETRIPTPDPSAPGQNWRAPDFETLWGQHMVGTSGPTVGDRITASLGPGQTIRQELDDLALRFPAVENRFTGNLYPRRAYIDGFLAPLVANPRAGLLGIIHWAPNYGLASSSRDDIALETGQELARTGRLGGMTTQARARYVRELIDGVTVGSEEDMVVQIFETAPPRERSRIYELVEGHRWTGDWIQGWLVTDDDIWDALDRPRLARVRALINAGWP